MAFKVNVAFFLCLNLISFIMVNANYVPTIPTIPTVPTIPTIPTVPTIPTIPIPNPTYDPSPKGTCPIDTLKLGVCAKVLKLVNVKLGAPPTLPCCSFIQGLADLEAAACLCTALKANVLGLHLNVPISLSLILNNCGRNNSGFQCS